MKYTIYALFDPNTHEVRYVGQTRLTLAKRLYNHECCARTGDTAPVYAWWRSLAPLKPLPMVLQYVEELPRIPLVHGNKNRRPGRDGAPGKPEHKAHAAEVKWMKRFERFHLLQFVDTKRAAYKRLKNPEE